MPPNAKYLLVSLPTSIAHTHDSDAAFSAIVSTVTRDYGAVHRFPIPEFKIGTLDALVLQADELAKLDSNVEGAVAKVVEVLRGCCVGADGEGEEEVGRHKMVNDSMCAISFRVGDRKEVGGRRVLTGGRVCR